MNSIFECNYGDLSPDLAQWLLGVLAEESEEYDPEDLDDDDEIPDDVRHTVVPHPYYLESSWVQLTWRSAAWEGGGPAKIAMRLDSKYRSILYTPDGRQGFERQVRQFMRDLNCYLVQHASEEEIIHAVKQVSDALGQRVTKDMAQCIVPMISRAELPLMVVQELCRKVAETESGKLKPASFTGLLTKAKRRLPAFREMQQMAREMVEHADAALVYLAERLAEEAEETARRQVERVEAAVSG